MEFRMEIRNEMIGKGREWRGKEGNGRERNGMEGKGREWRGKEGNGREREGMEGKGSTGKELENATEGTGA